MEESQIHLRVSSMSERVSKKPGKGLIKSEKISCMKGRVTQVRKGLKQKGRVSDVNERVLPCQGWP
jgi:hypothetical protein